MGGSSVVYDPVTNLLIANKGELDGVAHLRERVGENSTPDYSWSIKGGQITSAHSNEVRVVWSSSKGSITEHA